MPSKLEKNNSEQLIDLMSLLGSRINPKSTNEITLALAAELKKLDVKVSRKKYNFTVTDDDDKNRNYEYGCDYLVKSFEEDFLKAFENI